MKYYLIAGEASGDLHGSNLMKGLMQEDQNANFRFFGGDLMQAQGGVLVKHYRDMAFMAVIRVLLNFRTVVKNFRHCKRDIQDFNPDVLILIDFAGFNLRIARYAKQIGIRVFYYISPKVWAWHSSRVKTIKALVDKMFVIFPFEVEFYKTHEFEVEYLGNPTLDAIDEKINSKPDRNVFIQKNQLDDKPIVAILAGSRKQEIDLCLPEMLGVIPDYPDYQFIIAGAPGIPKEYYDKYIRNHPVHLVYNSTYDLLNVADAAVVTSGTATLETALMMVPEIVCYKTGALTYFVGWHIVRIRPTYFSLVNLIMNQEVVKEFLQFNLKEDISAELGRILNDNVYRDKMIDNFRNLRNRLGNPGGSQRIAKRIVELICQDLQA